MKSGFAAACLAGLTALAFAQGASAITPTVTEFSTGLNAGADPESIASGPDGAVWFADFGNTTRAIGRVTADGAIHEFPVSVGAKGPFDIASGLDGNLWFLSLGPSAVWRMTPAGDATPLGTANGLKPSSSPIGLAAGPDGNLWFGDPGGTSATIGRVTPSGTITNYSAGLTMNAFPNGFAAGPDGGVWFTDGGMPAVGRIDPATQLIQEFTDGLSENTSGIGAGPDGNLWFFEALPSAKIGSINPTTHEVREFTEGLGSGASLGGSPKAGPDGAMWFADDGSTPAIGRIAPDGSIQEFSAQLPPGSGPGDVALGADGNIWFTDPGLGAIGRLTTPPVAQTTSAVATGSTTATLTGTVDGHAQPTNVHFDWGAAGAATAPTTPQPLSGSSASVNLTGLHPGTTYQARVVATNGTGSAEGGFLAFTTHPLGKGRIDELKVSPAALVAAPRGGSVAAARTFGAIVSYRDSEPATTKFTVQRPAPGRRQGHACRKPGRRNRRGKHCTRYVSAGGFTHADTAGTNSFRFSGRVRHRKLKPGRYRLHAVARNAAGSGPPRNASFRVKRR